MEEERGKVISIYTPSVTLNSPDGYVKRLAFLGQVLTSGCPPDVSQEVTKEMLNIVEYLNLRHQRRLLREQQEKINPNHDE